MNWVNFCVLVDDSELENLAELNKEVPHKYSDQFVYLSIAELLQIWFMV